MNARGQPVRSLPGGIMCSSTNAGAPLGPAYQSASSVTPSRVSKVTTSAMGGVKGSVGLGVGVVGGVDAVFPLHATRPNAISDIRISPPLDPPPCLAHGRGATSVRTM